MAPGTIETARDGKTLGQICDRLKDPARGKNIGEIVERMAHDGLAGRRWNPGRAGVPGTRDVFGELIRRRAAFPTS
ncbi:hypothetical protein [Mesorhizobium sp. L-8-3]|uniref:hypothetical protein n=1 Tax=Mesorhizobium sp. L-8-3 TaxID=2744522 RepID=UPI0019290F20|nr:hypothetical protein [Mesorhizobium sp. L-8-3]BCH22797.1 hypothetical protein MesoLjLb_25820 [Mesorhizobium sp. L-8-3]